MTTESQQESRLARLKVPLGLLLGPLLAGLLLMLGAPGGLSEPAWRVVALTAWMAVWWVLEPVPIAVTALLPLVLLPLLEVAPIDEVAAPYANPLIFLFLGGFLLAEAIQGWGCIGVSPCWCCAWRGAVPTTWWPASWLPPPR